MKIIKFTIICLIFVLSFSKVNTTELTFNEWLDRFKKESIKKGISEKTFDEVMSNVKYLPKVIEYDRYQPEFYEDTFTYISKRSSNKKVKKGKKLYLTNKDFINDIEKKFSVEKELLLALMGIETNFGTYVGKMDILSCLATLSFDKRRSDFFSKELITILIGTRIVFILYSLFILKSVFYRINDLIYFLYFQLFFYYNLQL